jgi:hypothetical protein
MSLTEDIARISEVPETPAAIGRVLLVWDAPNLDMGLGSILGGRTIDVASRGHTGARGNGVHEHRPW